MNFYFDAVKLLDRIDSKQGSIKGILATAAEKDRKRLSALVIETLKYRAVLSDILRESNLMRDEGKTIKSMNLGLLLVHDLLFSNGIQAGEGPIKNAILRHKTRLNAELQRQKIKRGVTSNAALAQSADDRAEKIPRYVRVNTLVWTMDEAIAELNSRGFSLCDDPFVSPKGFSKDPHVANLLLFSPQNTFSDDVLIKEGKFILQDKASCFPALILSPPVDDEAVVIDATSAPGNKTTHLSALMEGKGKLFAFEKDWRRYKTLQMMLSKARCGNVEAVNADFLTISPTDAGYNE